MQSSDASNTNRTPARNREEAKIHGEKAMSKMNIFNLNYQHIVKIAILFIGTLNNAVKTVEKNVLDQLTLIDGTIVLQCTTFDRVTGACACLPCVFAFA